jgi:hypothetical protein
LAASEDRNGEIGGVDRRYVSWRSPFAANEDHNIFGGVVWSCMPFRWRSPPAANVDRNGECHQLFGDAEDASVSPFKAGEDRNGPFVADYTRYLPALADGGERRSQPAR